jgi:hypothetical protein
MVVWGFTALRNRLEGMNYLIYWLSCFVLVTAAIYLALWDFWVMSGRERQRELEERLKDVLKQDESNEK